MPNWSRSWFLLIAAVCLLAIVFMGVDRLFPQRPVPRIGIEVLLSAGVLAYWAWLQGWRKFLRETAPWVVIYTATLILAHRAFGLFHEGISGSFYTLILVTVAVLVWSLFVRLIGGGATGDRAAGRSLAEVWEELRARLASGPSWARLRALQQVPRIKAVSVKAADLAGVVEYDTMHFAGMRVEEYAADWVQQLSQVTTDDNGRFALPRTSDGPVHWVRVSWRGTVPAHLQVELSPDAQPLLVRLKHR